MTKRSFSTACYVILAQFTASYLTSQDRTLFNFQSKTTAGQWATVNDGVMGGVSKGRYQIGDQGTLVFYGNLSLKNNGGFASVRSRAKNLELQSGETLVARVKGDGREYSFNLYPGNRRTAFSYRLNFKTRKDEWMEIRLPLEKFVATSFGRILANRVVTPSEIKGVGILLGDKRPGPFQLEVAWVKVQSKTMKTLR
jgi:NADH dehydrogenase [ubiquinone] 1 alpha subcomplex assembly factor 1